jgi:hypothetical protein
MRKLSYIVLVIVAIMAVGTGTTSAQESTNRIQVFLTDSKLARYTDYVAEIKSRDTKKVIVRISNDKKYKTSEDEGIILDVQTKDVATTLATLKEVLRGRGFRKAKILITRYEHDSL